MPFSSSSAVILLSTLWKRSSYILNFVFTLSSIFSIIVFNVLHASYSLSRRPSVAVVFLEVCAQCPHQGILSLCSLVVIIIDPFIY